MSTQRRTPSAPAQPAPDLGALEPDPALHDHRVLLWLVAAAFVVILNETIMTTAIPRLMADLHVSASAAQWLSTVFMLTMAVVIPTTGYLLQRLTTRAAYLLAMGTFCAGTLLAGLAPTFAVLLLARVVQAVGTAIMMPLLMTTLMQVVHERDRGRVMGNVSLAISVAPAAGPAVSGVVLQALSWRWIFFLVLPAAAAIALLGLRGLRNVGEPTARTLDVGSVPLAIVGFGALVYGLSEVGAPATRAVGLAMLALGAVGVAAFTWRQLALGRRGGSPLLDVRVLRSGTFARSMAAMAIAFMALMGVVILLQLFLQSVLGQPPLVAGLVVMPGGIAMGLAAPVVGRLLDAHGARVLMIPGAVVLVGALAGTAWLVRAGATAPLAAFVGLHVALSLGLALLFTPLFTLGLGAVPEHLYAHGSSVLGTTQQVAGAMGTAAFVTVLAATGGDAAGFGWAFAVGVALAVATLALVLTLPARNAAAAPDAPEPQPLT
jgi:DHA2 family lincomycin resistance protein-like MFS transporter